MDKLEALLHQALDCDMGPKPRELIEEALSLVAKEEPYQCDGGRFFFSDAVTGVPWMAVLVRQGERYGSLNASTGTRWLVNDGGETLIEFWDRRYNIDPHHRAQFVQRYYLSTFKAHEGDLCLEGCTPIWTLCGRTVRTLQQAVK